MTRAELEKKLILLERKHEKLKEDIIDWMKFKHDELCSDGQSYILKFFEEIEGIDLPTTRYEFEIPCLISIKDIELWNSDLEESVKTEINEVI